MSRHGMAYSMGLAGGGLQHCYCCGSWAELRTRSARGALFLPINSPCPLSSLRSLLQVQARSSPITCYCSCFKNRDEMSCDGMRIIESHDETLRLGYLYYRHLFRLIKEKFFLTVWSRSLVSICSNSLLSLFFLLSWQAWKLTGFSDSHWGCPSVRHSKPSIQTLQSAMLSLLLLIALCRLSGLSAHTLSRPLWMCTCALKWKAWGETKIFYTTYLQNLPSYSW